MDPEDPDPTFQLVQILQEFFLIFLNINFFTFVFSSCNCVRMHIMTRYRLFRDFFKKRNLYFKIEHFC